MLPVNLTRPNSELVYPRQSPVSGHEFTRADSGFKQAGFNPCGPEGAAAFRLLNSTLMIAPALAAGFFLADYHVKGRVFPQSVRPLPNSPASRAGPKPFFGGRPRSRDISKPQIRVPPVRRIRGPGMPQTSTRNPLATLPVNLTMLACDRNPAIWHTAANQRCIGRFRGEIRGVRAFARSCERGNVPSAPGFGFLNVSTTSTESEADHRLHGSFLQRFRTPSAEMMKYHRRCREHHRRVATKLKLLILWYPDGA
jgi:hypothetical protein